MSFVSELYIKKIDHNDWWQLILFPIDCMTSYSNLHYYTITTVYVSRIRCTQSIAETSQMSRPQSLTETKRDLASLQHCVVHKVTSWIVDLKDPSSLGW